MRAKKVWRREQGFSLIEVMIAAGIMCLTALSVIAVQGMGLKGQKTLLAQDDARVLSDDISSLLTNYTACANTFSGRDPAVGFSVTEVKDLNSAVRYAAGNKYGNGVKLESITVGGAGVDERSGLQKWSGSGSSGTAFVRLHWVQPGGTENRQGPRDLYRYALINAALDSDGKISSCNSVTTGSSGTSQWITAGANIYYPGGNVGINTSNPVFKLDVAGGVRAEALHLCTSCGGGEGGSDPGSGTPNYLVKWNNATVLTDSIVFEGDGKIGIGTNAPANKLTVSGDANVTGKLGIGVASPASTVDVSGGVKLANDTGTCNASKAGTIRWTGTAFEGCNGSAWTALGGGPAPGTPGSPCSLPWANKGVTMYAPPQYGFPPTIRMCCTLVEGSSLGSTLACYQY